MKIAFGQRLVDGAWGGGNRFVKALAEASRERGDEAVYGLADDDIDIALITDPRAGNPALAFTPGAVMRRILAGDCRLLVVHRINECDERKGTHTMNQRLRLANYAADHTVFISTWLRELPVWRREGPSSVILNGADARLFDAQAYRPWSGAGALRLVTHHWGAHARKGFDVYARIDALLGERGWRERFAFTYVGNLPPGFAFANARHVPPLDGAPLAAELGRHHVYLTASINEPAGMHHIEGALSGLPLLYRKSGALPEYCAGFGEEFVGADDFPAALEAMAANYRRWQARMAAYPHTARRMCAAYLALFDDLMARRDSIVAARRPWRSLSALALTQVPL